MGAKGDGLTTVTHTLRIKDPASWLPQINILTQEQTESVRLPKGTLLSHTRLLDLKKSEALKQQTL